METYNSKLAPRYSQLLAQSEAELRALLRSSGNLGDAANEADSHEVADFKDMATEEALSAVDEVQADHAAHELEKVLAAQRRLAGQSYGLCLQCGEAIDLRRLTALPATPYCTACQTAHEQGRPPATRA